MKLSMMAAAAALMALCAGAAAAQDDHPGMAALRQACAADAQKLCPDKTGPDLHQCMMANSDKVSDGCKSAAAAMRKEMQDMQANKPQ